MQNALQLMESMLAEGFCLHGSGRRISTLEPQKARCKSGKDSGNQCAIYATPDDPAIACFMALYTKKNLRLREASASYSKHGDGPLVLRGGNITFRPGFVYALPSETFEWFENEWISRVPVTPHLTISVTPDILHLLLNIQLEIPVPTTW